MKRAQSIAAQNAIISLRFRCFPRALCRSSSARRACRGVAQPGRAPGSGPGGRRFKSSLPDHYLQTHKRYFWFFDYIDGVEIVDGACTADIELDFQRENRQDFQPTCQMVFTQNNSSPLMSIMSI